MYYHNGIILFFLLKIGFNCLANPKLIKEFRPDLPIVVQTAYSTQAEKNKIINAGCDDFISKPISEESFRMTLNKYLTTK